MEPSYPPPRQERQLRGPRPAPLRVSKSSHKIKKQPPRDPVVIYTISPKVIHVDAADFMGIVQSLTGPSEGGQALSPGNVLDQLEIHRPVDKPGILSPAPASLPPISPAFFSPSYLDPSFLSFLHDLSPMGLLSGRPSHSQGGASGGDGNFFISPGKFLSTPLVPSPRAAVWDLFNQFQNFS